MSKIEPTWFEVATRVLANLPDVSTDHEVDFFDHRPRIAIRVQSLDGLGIVHQQAAPRSFSLCVFEPSQRESSGFAEVFERHMNSLDELPEQISAWRDFRSATSTTNISTAQADYAKLLKKMWRWKQKCASLFNAEPVASFGARLAAVGVDVDIESLGGDWPGESQAKLKRDLDSIVPELLAWHLPCDDTGQWFLKRRVPLYRYEYDKRRQLDACLVLVLPDNRSGRARLETDWLNADSQSVRLDATPEFFDSRVTTDFVKNILGGVAIAQGNGKRTARQPSRNAISQSRAAQLLDLQHSGKFAEACAIVGLEVDGSVEACLAAKRVSDMCTCCAPLDKQLVAWSELLKQTMLSMNLTTLVPLLVRDQSRRARPRREPIPIIPFPLQRHTRKAHLAIDICHPSQPRLMIAMTGSMNRVPIPLWRRPMELDVLSHSIADLSQIPAVVCKQLAGL